MKWNNDDISMITTRSTATRHYQTRAFRQHVNVTRLWRHINNVNAKEIWGHFQVKLVHGLGKHKLFIYKSMLTSTFLHDDNEPVRWP